jgi:carbonic anhydrase
MNRLKNINKSEDIFSGYRSTPIGDLLEYHNLKRTFQKYEKAELVIGTCMDNRINLRIPDHFAYIIRTGGVNLKFNEFQISYAFALGYIQHMALIGHNHCGMSNLVSRKDRFIDGLCTTAGWTREEAGQHFSQSEPVFEIGDEIDFIISEVKRFQVKYPKVTFAPLFYNVDDHCLYLIKI